MNWRWIALVSIVVSLLGAGCARDANVRKQRHLEKAAAYASAGKQNEAIVELRNALQLDPAYVPALHALGIAYRAKSAYLDAAHVLQRAVHLQPDRLDIRADLGVVHLALEAWDSALEQAKLIRQRRPDDPYGLYVAGAALVGKGNASEAVDLLRRAAGARPRPEVHKTLGDALVRLDWLDDAEQAYRTAVDQDSRYVDALVALGELMMKRQRHEAAIELLARARTLSPAHPTARMALSVLLAHQGRLDEAIEEVEALPPPTRPPRASLWLGELCARTGRFERGVAVLAPFVEKFPDVGSARYVLGDNLLGLKRYEAAIDEFQRALQLDPDLVLARFKRAVAYSRSERPRLAIRDFQAVGSALGRIPEYHLELGLAYLAAGELTAARRSAQTALKLSPGDPRAPTLLGAIHTQRGEFSEALAMYGKAPNFAPARLGRGLVLTLQKKPDDALAEYDAALEAETGNADAVLAKVATLVADHRVDVAIRLLHERVGQSPTSARYVSALGRLYWLTKEPRKAEEQFRRALTIDDSYTPARLNLARLAVSEGRHSDAVQQLHRILADQPTHLLAAFLLAAAHARQGRFDVGIAALESSVRANRDSVPHGVTVYLAELYLNEGRYDEALARLLPLVRDNAGLAPARMMVGIAYLGKRRIRDAIKEFEHVRRLAPALAMNHYHLGRAFRARGDIAAAKEAYRHALAADSTLEEVRIELAALSSDEPDATLLAGGVEDLERAADRDPANIAARYAVGRAYFLGKQLKDAEREFRRALEINAEFVPAQMGLALIRAQEGKPDEAAEYLRAVLQRHPTHLQANLLLGRYYDAKGVPDLAVRHFQIVHTHDASRGDVTLALARLYAQIGRLDEGLARAREFVAAHPKDARGYVAVADVLRQQSKIREAIAAYTMAVRMDPGLTSAHLRLAALHHKNHDLDKAIAGYRQVIALAPADPSGYNNLAWLYTERRSKLDEALSLARKARDLAPENGSILDTLGWVHYARGEFDRAESILRRAVDLRPNDARIQYHLGMAYYRLGRQSESSVALRRALELDPQLQEAPEIAQLLRQLSG